MSWREKSAVVGSSKKEDKEGALSRVLSGAKDVLSEMPRQAGLAARNVLTGVTGIPAIGADLTMSGVNFLLPQSRQQQMPSQAFQNLLTKAGLPEAQTGLESGLGIAQSALAGSAIDPMAAIAAFRAMRIPASSAERAAGPLSLPAQAPIVTPRGQTFYEARTEGYVLPPASARPGIDTQVAESLSGKRLAAEAASEKNQIVTNTLAARALGLSENQPITPESLRAVRTAAGEVYEEIRNSGQIIPDEQYLDDIIKISSNVERIASDFGGLNVGARDEIKKLVDGLLQNRFSADAAVTLLRTLRNNATKRISSPEPDQSSLGLAERSAATALENAILRHLRASGRDDLAEKFASARTTIAKSHDVEAATNLATGDVNPLVIGRMRAAGEPLTGELDLIGRMGASFPRAMTPRRDSTGVTALDIGILGGGIAGGYFADNPVLAGLGVAAPFLRRGYTQGLLSDPVQNVLSRPSQSIPGRAAGGVSGLLAGETEEERRRRMMLAR
jgi:hypothetical protein